MENLPEPWLWINEINLLFLHTNFHISDIHFSHYSHENVKSNLQQEFKVRMEVKKPSKLDDGKKNVKGQTEIQKITQKVH